MPIFSIFSTDLTALLLCLLYCNLTQVGLETWWFWWAKKNLPRHPAFNAPWCSFAIVRFESRHHLPYGVAYHTIEWLARAFNSAFCGRSFSHKSLLLLSQTVRKRSGHLSYTSSTCWLFNIHFPDRSMAMGQPFSFPVSEQAVGLKGPL